MRLGIDVRYLSHGLIGGVHTYVRHFVPPLLQAADQRQHQVTLYADTKRPFELTPAELPVNTTVRLLPYQNTLSAVLHDLTLGRHMAHDRIEVAHFPANTGVGPASARSVVTLHDAINILPLAEIWRGHQKKPRTLAMMTYLHMQSRSAVHKAHAILTVSEYAKRAIAEVGHISPDHIVAVPHAPMPEFRRITDATMLEDVRQRHGLPERFVLADALKNPAVLVKAWRMLPDALRAGRKIMFFSRRPDPLPIVFEATQSGHALLLVRPSREDLIALYSMADAFVFPSWIEGFGLPVLEAMVCGAPVIASNRGSIPEVASNAALIADAEDVQAFAAHLQRVLSSADEAQRWRERGYVRAAQFSWQKTAEMILRTYEAVAQNEVPARAVMAMG